MSVLLNCPFCGGEAERATSDAESPVICIECSASTPDPKCWNARHALDVVRTAINHWAEHEPEICRAPEYTDIMTALSRGVGDE